MSNRSSLSSYIKVLMVLVILGGVGVWWYLQSRPVFQVEPVSREKAVNSVSASVTVREEIPTSVRSPVAGLISEAKLEIGAAVKTGDVLVQLDVGDVNLEIRTTEESITALKDRIKVGSEAELAVRLAEIDFKNNEFARDNNLISAVDFEKAKIAFDGAKLRRDLENVNNHSNLKSLETTLEVKKRLRDKMTIRSPVDGQIADVMARTGNLISSEQPLVTIISTTRIVEAKISEENFAGVTVGKSAQVRFLKYGWKTFDASVAKVLPMADPLTQRKVVYLNVDLPPDQLDPGLTGEVAIKVDEHDNALVVPRRALLGRKVFVVKDGVVEPRKVTTGFVGINTAEILDGLTDGELVVVEQLDLVYPGDRVRTKVNAR